jgi:hypothetical protein
VPRRNKGKTSSKRRAGGSKLSRTETVTVRLDPKLRYLAELGARKQRRTLSSFIEWAIEESLKQIDVDGGRSIADLANVLWDVDAADRFAMLALRNETLLSHDEQVMWKLVRDNPLFWCDNRGENLRDWSWRISESNMNFEHLRERWALLLAIAHGELDPAALENPLRPEND